MKSKINKLICAALAVIITIMPLSACGRAESEKAPEAVQENSPKDDASGETDNAATGNEAEGEEKYPEFLVIDVFDSQANYQGIQSGWFGKIVKDKFNMELNIIAPNVAGNGETLYQTRSANGNLGDLILINADKNRLKDLVQAELVINMEPYMGECLNLQKYMDAIDITSELAEAEGKWAVPSMISTMPSTEPSQATDPMNAASLRWDLYKELGYPEIETMEELLPVLKQMQELAGASDSGKNVYAFSLFKDWDGDIMQNVGALTSLYGYTPMGFALLNMDDGTTQSVIDSDSEYVRALRFLYDANQMGLVDPESTTQNYDVMAAKYADGAVLYSFWPWLGVGQYNNEENTSQGKGFQSAVINDAKFLTGGNYPVGDVSFTVMVGSKAKDPQRLVDFIDWLYSPEGIEASGSQSGGSCGPQGLTWEMKDGKPVLTEFGVKAFIEMDENLQVPEEWGTGTWKDGISALNFKPVGVRDYNDELGISYNYTVWDDYRERTSTALSEDWSAHTGAATAIEYFNELGIMCVHPGTTWVSPDYSTDINAVKEQCKQIIVEYSWKMIFCNSEEEFNELLNEMQGIVTGLGYESVLEIDLQNCNGRYTLVSEARSRS